MDLTELLKTAEELTQPWAKEPAQIKAERIDVSIASADLQAVVKAIFDADWGYLSAITGLDHPAALPAAVEGQPEQPLQGELEVLYHFCEGAAVLTLRVSLPYDHPEIPTVCNIIPSATLYERELIELFGVTVVGTPDTSRLVLPDDWPDGIYPLRKSFTGFPATQDEEDKA
jgi:Ni,Fe-hydrogenase III component G